MKLLKKSLIFSFFIGLIGCYNPFLAQEGFFASRVPNDYEVVRQRSQNRDQIIRRTSELYAGQKCSSEDKNHACYKVCEELYKSRRDRKDCENLTVKQVEKINALHETLKDAREDELDEIQPDLFELYLSFSIEPFDDIASDLQRRERKSKAENLMIWLVSHEDMVSIFEDSDRDYVILTKLLDTIDPFIKKESYPLHLPLSKAVDGSNTLVDVIVEEGTDDSTLEWIMEFIEESPQCDESISEACFEVYCQIGSAMNKREREDLLDKNVFESYIEDILEDSINKSHWKTAEDQAKEDLENVNDLNDDWVETLCGSLISS